MDIIAILSDIIAIMDIESWTSNIIAFIALSFSGVTFMRQRRLDNLLIAKEEGDAINSKKADLGAKFVKNGNNQDCLQVFNKGKAMAKNVRIEIPDGNDFLIQGDIDGTIFPMKTMEENHQVNLIALTSMGSKPIKHIKFTWDDDFGENQTKSIYLTI